MVGTKSSNSSGKDTGKKRNNFELSSRRYKHLRHCEKPIHIVERRNARERRRVENVNQAFSELRKALPQNHKENLIQNPNGQKRRLSKVKTLQKAIEYITELENLLSDNNDGNDFEELNHQKTCNLNKENQLRKINPSLFIIQQLPGDQ